MAIYQVLRGGNALAAWFWDFLMWIITNKQKMIFEIKRSLS